MAISIRTARAAIIICSLSGAIAPIGAVSAQTHCEVQSNPRATGTKTNEDFLLNGKPATAAQVKACEAAQHACLDGKGKCETNAEAAKKAKADAVKEALAKEKGKSKAWSSTPGNTTLPNPKK